MSSVKISGDASGTGIFTLSAPNSNTNRALVLPDSAGTMATAESTLVQFNVTGSAPVFACRAFVNFNGQGTVAIRASGNVSSITDNGTGLYVINITTAMPDANYSISVNVSLVFGSANMYSPAINTGTTSALEVAPTTGAFSLYIAKEDGSRFAPKYVNVAIFR